jgi:methylmalonyl-CoA mutase
MRSGDHEKQAQLANLRAVQERWSSQAPEALASLKRVALSGDNVFEELMKTVRYASLGQISDALYEIGGRYRRAM